MAESAPGEYEKMMQEQEYYNDLTDAYVRGRIRRSPALDRFREQMFDRPCGELTHEELLQVWDQDEERFRRRYMFKQGHEEMPRVKMALGFLKSVQPASLLDVGSGRGVFLFPFLEMFPYTEVTSIDLLPHRVEFLQTLQEGGIERLHALEADICDQPLPDNSVEVVTMLEVCEHIPDVQAAVNAAIQIASRFVVVSVPSKPDDNPEHIHLLTREKLTDLFRNAGCRRLHFDGVNGHLFMTAAAECR